MPNTESLNPRFADIDSWPTIEAVEAMLEGQMAAIASLKSQTPHIAAAAEAAAARLQKGGRLVYVGAGTSGRVAVQDGVELGPTFGWPAERLVYLMAGGIDALVHSAEGAEDDADDAISRISESGVNADDVVIGVAASGRTPFTIAALTAAKEAGALTIAIANNAETALLHAAHHGLLAATGSEAIAGSTRMKAGTAQKAILNLLSTAIMLRLGRVYRGLMVDMVISNDKLLNRAFGIVRALSHCSEALAIEAVHLAGNDIKTAVLIALGKDPSEAAALLRDHGGILRDAIKAMDGKAP
ncbi:MAG TPA: N-acetylmuramic acid 6-phosphate etherase [Sphingopyxis sp.]|jgi:N-acetylmuramic acid 6-phosphate etherase|uniref:N-acetylmuramic acid 6-phosphate etherase n=1 Tax=Sphingopyxis sp. TaxID=1908224 RepID=UPI002E0E3F3C|nr:N-acetylmuramic acid 6-phosphate etherase [Sphingopyxis sp.]